MGRAVVALLAALGLAGVSAAAVESAVLARVPEALPGAPPLPPTLRAQLARALAALGEAYVPRTRNLRDDGSPLFTNRLLLEPSPYLRQHAHNPVNWYPWGDEAFETARRLDRPVLVSIGYSTCHWCHVMEEESFDDPALAAYLNAHFIAIKVDREARPDVDSIYMTAVHAMNQRGGWPLNVWVTPDGEPFFGGTYFPPEDRHRRPSFRRVLGTVEERYRADPDQVKQLAGQIAEAVRMELESASAQATRIPGPETLKLAKSQYTRMFDATWGGVGRRPKFPSRLPVRFLLRYHRRTGDAEALRMATLTLEKMAAGGIHDQIGGGFHRYSTDQRWLVPHFEKMLYDNALLAVAYLEAWQATGRDEFARVTRRTLRYVLREMTAPEGGFYSATDADSPNPEGENEEGWFFTWTPAEIRAALPEIQAAAVIRFYAVSDGGNFEGRNILHVPRPLEQVAGELELSPAALRERLDEAGEALYRERQKRPPPLRDEKILAEWNGLMISAFARAGFALEDPAYTRAAKRAALFVLGRMREQGRLVRVWKDGRARGPAFLEDYAFVIAGLLDLYEADPDPRWLREAIALQAQLDRHYADPTGGGYFKTAADGERLLAREKPGDDGAVPSGNSVEALNLLRLHAFTGRGEYLGRAGMLLSAFHETLDRRPSALSEMLLAVDYDLDAAKEVVVVRRAPRDDLDAMLAPLRRSYVPNRIVAVVTQGDELEAHAALVPLVGGKVARRGKVTAYVCENGVCDFPTSEPAKFAVQLRKVEPLE